MFKQSPKYMIFLLFIAFSCRPQLPTAPAHCKDAQTTRLTTDDGAEIVLHRHPAAGPPVIVVHGIASNHRCWDLTEDRSLAEALQRAGMDAWLLNLRGHGEAMMLADGTRQRHGWALDDYGAHDLHTAIEHVRNVRTSATVAVVGHSMGGMVAAVYNGHHGDDALSALVIVGSPIEFSNQDILLNMGTAAMRMGSLWRSLGIQTGASILGQLPGGLPVHGEGILFNPKNLDPSVRTQMLQEVVSPVSREEMQQFNQILQQEKFTSVDGTMDYAEALRSLDVPLLAIAGSRDKIVSPSRVSPWIDAVSSDDTTYIEAGTANGFSVDYGHLDLALGDAAGAEIHTPIANWLHERVATD
jgi:polyhydroxyalkanoate synthase